MWLSLELTVRPWKTGHPKRKCHLPNYEFSAANLLLVSGRVFTNKPGTGGFRYVPQEKRHQIPQEFSRCHRARTDCLDSELCLGLGGVASREWGKGFCPMVGIFQIKEPKTSASSNKILQGIPPNKGMWKKNIGCPKNIKHILYLYLSGIPLIKPSVKKHLKKRYVED